MDYKFKDIEKLKVNEIEEEFELYYQRNFSTCVMNINTMHDLLDEIDIALDAESALERCFSMLLIKSMVDCYKKAFADAMSVMTEELSDEGCIKELCLKIKSLNEGYKNLH